LESARTTKAVLRKSSINTENKPEMNSLMLQNHKVQANAKAQEPDLVLRESCGIGC